MSEEADSEESVASAEGGAVDEERNEDDVSGSQSKTKMRLMIRYARLCHARPGLILSIILSVLIGISLFVVLTGELTLSEETGYEWYILGDTMTDREDALEAAAKTIRRTSLPRIDERDSTTLYFIFTAKNGNALTTTNIAAMKDVEDTVIRQVLYESYCLLDRTNGTQCSLPESSLNTFYSSYCSPGGDCIEDRNSTIMQPIPTATASLSNDMFQSLYYFDNLNFVNQGSAHVRSKIKFGHPLEGFEGVDSDTDQSRAILNGIIVPATDALAQKFDMKDGFLQTKYMKKAETNFGELDVMWFSWILREEEFQLIVQSDLMFAVFSLLAVLFYMSFHVGSIIIALVGMFEIVISLPVALFIYKVILRIKYFSFIHLLVVFVILGIGADDVFVYVDAFKQSKYEKPRDGGSVVGLEQRLEFTCNRASKAIFVTSLTTTFAFLATALSKLMPISSFGIYSSLVISILYLVNVVLLPPVLILHTKYLEDKKWIICLPARMTSKCTGCFDSQKSIQERNGLRFLEWFYKEKFFPLLYKMRFIAIISFMALFIGGLICVLKLEPPAEQEQWFPVKHMFQRFNEKETSGAFLASAGDLVAEVSLVWGLLGMDTGAVDRWNPEERGKLLYDFSFDPSSAQAQVHLLSSCAVVGNEPCLSSGCTQPFLVRRNCSNGTESCVPDSSCFINGFDAWLRETKNSSIPVAQPLFLPYLYEFSLLNSTEIEYPDQIGFSSVASSTTGIPNLDFVQFKFQTTYVPPKPAKVVEPIVDDWEALTTRINLAAPAGCNQAYQVSIFFWAWLKSQTEIVESAKMGVILCFAFSYLVLNITTGNVILATLSELTIAGIVLTVLGVGVQWMQGWNLGVAEAIASQIIIGFSVDYCVHLAGAYRETKFSNRIDRTRGSLQIMGISITAGAITTILSGVFLYGCTLVFFTKFAFLVVSTIVASFLWSMVFFAASCSVVGPNDEGGDWMVMLPWVWRKIRRIPKRDGEKDTVASNKSVQLAQITDP